MPKGAIISLAQNQHAAFETAAPNLIEKFIARPQKAKKKTTDEEIYEKKTFVKKNFKKKWAKPTILRNNFAVSFTASFDDTRFCFHERVEKKTKQSHPRERGANDEF